ncbi:hypothetical protein [Mycobacterium sp. TY815]|nr:hypothetical protein [Mycobacterium sp. TY815]MDP7707136.1 hypothetical protein [Mycobacterium sp. TY815]
MPDRSAQKQQRGGRHRDDTAAGRHFPIPHHRVVLASLSAGVVVMAGYFAVATDATKGHGGDRVAQSATTSPGGALAPQPTPVPQASAPASTDTLEADFGQLRERMRGKVAIAISAVGADARARVLGDWPAGQAWSTIKVPLAIAVLRETNQTEVSQNMVAAITDSDNAAAESLWSSLGEPSVAAQKVEAVLRETGDQTEVQSRRVRPPFTAFGQTIWSLTAQTRFISSAVCDTRNGAIFALMGRITPDQSWGLGNISGARFKGGWGPKPTGEYLVRQIGVIPTPGGMTAVSMAVEPASGSLAQGTEELSDVASWLFAHRAQLPTGECST